MRADIPDEQANYDAGHAHAGYIRKKRKGKREEDLSGLPVTRVDYELPEEERRCPQCGETMRWSCQYQLS